MSPFHSLRLWFRRAPRQQTISAAAGAFVVMAVLAYLMVPASRPSASVDTGAFGSPVNSGQPGRVITVGPGATPAAGGARGGATPGRPGANTPGAGSTGGNGGNGGNGGGGCVTPPGLDQGVTDTQIKVAIALVNIFGPAANETFGIPTPDEQKVIWKAIIDGTNAQGGVACRQVVPSFFTANPADPSNLQSTCLDIAQSKPFLVFDSGSYSQGNPVCFAQARVPYFGGYLLTQKQAEDGYPYLFNLANLDRLLKDTVFAFRDRGAFKPANGFAKLGLFYHDCHPELFEEEIGWLHQAGLDDSHIVTYNFGCPTAFANPSDVTQAIVNFRSQGVSHVTYIDAKGDFQEFTTIAEQQHFRPRYVLPDDELLGIAYGTLRPNSANVVNAQIVTNARSGEERTPGMTPAGATLRCDALLTAHGLPPTYKEEQLAGNACNQLWMFQAAIEHAPALQRTALAAGLERARSVDFSYPSGPNSFVGDRVTTAGQFWRVDQFFPSCDCWRVIDPVFHPNY